MSYTTETFDLSGLYGYATALVSTEHDAPTLRCSACDMSVETHESAHDEPEAAIYALLSHAAFDHAVRADVLEYRLTRVIKFARNWDV
jgi:hypothetical protein